MGINLSFEEVEDIEDKLTKFVRKVDSGKARSKVTYEDIKYILALFQRKKEKAFKDKLIRTAEAK